MKEPEPYLEELIREIDFILDKDYYFEILVQREVGLTNAILEGVKKAKGDLVLVMDADGSHNPNYIPLMLLKFGEYSIVVGTKTINEDSFTRRIISEVFNFMAKKMLKLKIGNPMSNFFLVRKDLFRKVKSNMGHGLLLQLLVYNFDVSVGEVPIVFEKRKAGESHANLLFGLRALWLVFCLKLDAIFKM